MAEKPSKRELYEKHWAEEQSLTALGDEYGVDRVQVKEWMQEDGVRRRYTYTPGSYAFIHLSKRRLYELYWEEEMNFREIAERYGTTRTRVAKQFTEKGVPFHESHARNVFIFRRRSKHFLYELYWGEKLHYREIADRVGVNVTVVRDCYRASDVPVEEGQARGWYTDSIPHKFKLPSDEPNDDPEDHPQHADLPDDPDPSKYITETPLRFDKERLYELHWGYGLSAAHIQALFEVDCNAPQQMRDLGIPVRAHSEHLRWEPHLGVPPMFEWTDEEEDWGEAEDEISADDYNAAVWRKPEAGD